MTLVEILVVLAIVAVMAAAAGLATGSNGGVKAQGEARRIAALIQYASDRAMIDDTPRALVLEPGGYHFAAWDDVTISWQPVTAGGELAGRHVVPAGSQLAALDGGSLFVLGGDASGQALAVRLDAPGGSFRIDFDGIAARVSRVDQKAIRS